MSRPLAPSTSLMAVWAATTPSSPGLNSGTRCKCTETQVPTGGSARKREACSLLFHTAGAKRAEFADSHELRWRQRVGISRVARRRFDVSRQWALKRDQIGLGCVRVGQYYSAEAPHVISTS